jgi:hypothetical protein
VSHKGIRLLLEDTARSLGDDIQFDYGRTSDFNQIPNKRYPFVSVLPLNATGSFTVNNTHNYVKTYQVISIFYQIDQMASDQSQYALVMDEMNELADKFIVKLNFYIDGCFPDSDNLVITNITQQPLIKETGDILTGYIMTFSLQVSDDFNYCGLGC